MSPIKPVWVAVTVLGLLALAYQWVGLLENRPFATIEPPPRTPKSESHSIVNQGDNLLAENQKKKGDDESNKQREKTIRELEAIYYSDLTKEEMREKLKPYFQFEGSEQEYRNKTGLRGFIGSFTQANPSSRIWHSILEFGVTVSTGDNGKVTSISIHRPEKTVNNIYYPPLYIAP